MPTLLLAERHLYPSVVLRTALERLEWVSGEPFAVSPPRLEFEFEGGTAFEWPDFIRPNSSIPLFSARLRELLEANGVQYVDYYPASITNHSTGETRNYHAANILSRAAAMDRVRSQFTPARRHPVMVRSIERLVLDASRAEGLALFRLAEYDSLIVVSGALCQALEQAELHGLLLVPPQEWDGFSD